MRRKALIATLFLPLPFAALPLAGVLVGMSGGAHTVVVNPPAVEQRQIQQDVPWTQPDPLAYGMSNPLQSGCDVSKELRSES